MRKVNGHFCKLFIFFLVFAVPPAHAQDVDFKQLQESAKKFNAKQDPLVIKVGADLANLKIEYEEFLSKNITGDFQPSNQIIQVRGRFVVIEAIANEDTETLLSDLQSLGLQKSASFGRMVSGLLPINAIDEMAGLTGLHFARPAYKPITHIGSVTSQGDSAQRSDDARTKFSVDGSGITVGVLSDSYDDLSGASGGVTSGDLPGTGNPNGYTTPVNVLDDLGSSGTDEGRAMLEIIHDVAPGAALAFHTAFNGQADFANGIIELANVAGADVIVDDVSYFAEPFFQVELLVANSLMVILLLKITYFIDWGLGPLILSMRILNEVFPPGLVYCSTSTASPPILLTVPDALTTVGGLLVR